MQEQSQTGNYRYVSLNDAIIDAKDDLGITNNINDITLTNLAYKAVLDMNPISLVNIINEVVDVEGGIAMMPNNCISFLAMRYCDNNGNTYGPYIADLVFLEQCNCSLANADVGDYKGILTFSDDRFIWYDAANAPTKIKVAFMGRKLEPNGSGLPLIRDYMVDAVAKFIKYRFAQKFLNTSPPRYTPLQYEEWKREWIGARNAVISGDAQQNFILKIRSFANKLTPPLISF